MNLNNKEKIKLIQGARREYISEWDYSDFLEEYHDMIKRGKKNDER